MKITVPLLLSAALAGCSTSAKTWEPAPAAPPRQPGSTPARSAQPNSNDCAVIAAVAREHYEFDKPEHTPPPLWLSDADLGWSPRCDWAAFSLSFPDTYRPGGNAWVRFNRPRYDGQGATIEAGIMYGPLAGMGVKCRLRSGVAGWTVSECRNTWIS